MVKIKLNSRIEGHIAELDLSYNTKKGILLASIVNIESGEIIEAKSFNLNKDVEKELHYWLTMAQIRK